MNRLLFEKTGNAVWMSHLDLMRLFQRAFKRSGLLLKHTQGFNPRPSVSIALPLSVGVSSNCELLDFELEGQDVDCTEIMQRLNQNLVAGVRVLDCYTSGRKLKELALLRCRLTFAYDNGIPNNGIHLLTQFFEQPSIIVPKKTKNGVQDQDIVPMVEEISLKAENGHIILLEALVCCQNPTLNPMQLSAAVELRLPEMKPDFVKCSRLEIYDAGKNVFR